MGRRRTRTVAPGGRGRPPGRDPESGTRQGHTGGGNCRRSASTAAIVVSEELRRMPRAPPNIEARCSPNGETPGIWQVVPVCTRSPRRSLSSSRNARNTTVASGSRSRGPQWVGSRAVQARSISDQRSPVSGLKAGWAGSGIGLPSSRSSSSARAARVQSASGRVSRCWMMRAASS